MREKTINYIEGTVDEPLGYVGENNETRLIITPPEELTEDAAIVSYIVAFGVDGNIYRSAPIEKDTTITCDLWQETTGSKLITIQLEATDESGNILAKSQVLYGKFLPSIDGADVASDPELSPFVNQVVANTAARHTHPNKALLDDIPEYSTADVGKFLSVRENGIEWNAIELSIAEIALTEAISNYTAQQLVTMEANGYTFTYQGEPVAATGKNSSGTEFYFTVFDLDGSDTYIRTYRVQNNKVISAYGLSSNYYLLKSINGVPTAASADITIKADDIQATENYAPTNDADIATKKYVDDNAGNGFVAQDTAPSDTSLLWIDTDDNTGETIEWSAIQNKPASFPPSAHTHAYSDITNPPAIPIAGQIASGDTGYATGGDVFTALSAKQDKLPNGTANGDIPVWDNTNQEWAARPKWQMYFQPVEYVESTGKGNYSLGDRYQYINTGYIPTANTMIEAEIAFTDDTIGQFIGVRNWRSSTDKRALFFGLRYSNGTKYLALFTMYPESTPVQIAFDTNRHHYSITSTEQKIDNNTFTLDYSNMPSDANGIPLYLFANNAYFYNASTKSDIGFASCRIYSFAIKEGNTLVRDFIPCYRIADSVIGMYDTVNGVFYTNAGTGTFIKGADV